MKPVQFFSEEYLARVRRADTGEILQFLENFRLLQRFSGGERRTRKIRKERSPSAGETLT